MRFFEMSSSEASLQKQRDYAETRKSNQSEPWGRME